MKTNALTVTDRLSFSHIHTNRINYFHITISQRKPFARYLNQQQKKRINASDAFENKLFSTRIDQLPPIIHTRIELLSERLFQAGGFLESNKS